MYLSVIKDAHTMVIAPPERLYKVPSSPFWQLLPPPYLRLTSFQSIPERLDSLQPPFCVSQSRRLTLYEHIQATH